LRSLHPHLPTEAAIRGAVLSIRSEYGRVQQLAEAFFEAREGLKFRPIGRNNDGATTKGYPDAYAIEADGRWAVAEATVGDWRKHIREEDLPRLARIGKGRISCYRLLVLRDEEPALPQTNSRPRLPADSENSLRKEIADVCGLPIGAVEFIFLKQLVRELRGPAHFRLLLDLQLPISPVPFDLAEQVRPIGIQEITPTEEDFADGAVVPEQASTDLIEILRQKGTVVLCPDTLWPSIEVNTVCPKKKGSPKSKVHEPVPALALQVFAGPFGPPKLGSAKSPVAMRLSPLSTKTFEVRV